MKLLKEDGGRFLHKIAKKSYMIVTILVIMVFVSLVAYDIVLPNDKSLPEYFIWFCLFIIGFYLGYLASFMSFKLLNRKPIY